MKLSEKFKARVWLDERKMWQIAFAAQVNPGILSRMINGYEKIKQDDQRVIRVGKVLGMNENELFEEPTHGTTAIICQKP